MDRCMWRVFQHITGIRHVTGLDLSNFVSNRDHGRAEMVAPLPSCLLADLIQLHFGAVRIGDVDRQPVRTVVQILKELDAIGL